MVILFQKDNHLDQIGQPTEVELKGSWFVQSGDWGNISISKTFHHLLTRFGLFPFSLSFPLCDVSCSENQRIRMVNVLKRLQCAKQIHASNKHCSFLQLFTVYIYIHTHFSEAMS